LEQSETENHIKLAYYHRFYALHNYKHYKNIES